MDLQYPGAAFRMTDCAAFGGSVDHCPGISLGFFVKEARLKRAVDEPQNLPPAKAPVSVLEAFKTLPFYLLVVGSMCSVAAVSGVQQNLKLFLSLDRHYTQNLATRVLSDPDLQHCRAVVDGMVGRSHSDQVCNRTVHLLGASAIPILLFRPTPFALYIFFGYLRNWPGWRLYDHSTYGGGNLQPGNSGKPHGCLLTADGVAEAISRWFVGRMRDSHGTYFAGFLAFVGVDLLGALAVSGLSRKRRVA
jgi:hypothetical protein